MAKDTVAAQKPTERVYALSRETKGSWVYMWDNAPKDTPDWAKKWYVLKSDQPMSISRLVVTIAPKE
jgi:hypothetical protein